MGSNLEIQYKAFITGKSTILPGDLRIDFVFEGSDWMKNPCEGEYNIAGLKNRKCKRIDDKLHIEMDNEMSIDAVNYLGKFWIKKNRLFQQAQNQNHKSYFTEKRTCDQDYHRAKGCLHNYW